MRWILLAGIGVLLLAPFAFPDIVARLAPLLLYFPEKLRESDAPPDRWGVPDAEQIRLETTDGLRLHGWWAPTRTARTGEAPAAAVFFHGNAGHLAWRAPIVEGLRDLGLSVLLFDYRGYGLSEGRPTEQGLDEDGRAALRYVVERRGIPARDVVLVGNSLGAAVAARVAAGDTVAGLVVTSGFRSLPSIGRALYPWLPARFFAWTRNRFDAEVDIRAARSRVLVGWGTEDEFIPRSETRGLYEAAPEPKRWVEVEGAGHNDLWGSAELWEAMRRFLLEPRSAEAAGDAPR